MSYSIVGGDGKPYGPYGAEEIRKFYAEGMLNAQSLVHLAGEAEWTPLGKRADFADLFAPQQSAQAPQPPPPPPAPAYAAPAYAPPSQGWGTPPPSTTVPNPIPWEAKPRGPAVNALVDTAKLFALTPAEAWKRTPPLGDYIPPLLYALILSWIGGFFSVAWSRLFTTSWISMLPPEARQALPAALLAGAGSGIGTIIFYPILISVGLFIGSAVAHVCMMIVGGLKDSNAGYEGTFRSLSYSAVADLAYVIPIGGGLVAAVWKTWLVVQGLSTIHRTTQGKALMAVLIPVLLCCVCAIVGIFFGAAALMSAFNR